MSRLRTTSRLRARPLRPAPIACAAAITAITAASGGQSERTGIPETDVARRSELRPADGNGTEAVTSPFATPTDHFATPSTTYAIRTPGDAALTAFSCASLGTTPAMTHPSRPAVDTTASCCTTARGAIEPTTRPDRSLNAMFG